MPDVSYLMIEHSPNKTIYRVGDKFERYGMIVKAYYTDGSITNVDFFDYSPTRALTQSDTIITISALDKTITQSISVLPNPSEGYFSPKYLANSNYGSNPYINSVDGSFSFYNNPITVERDSYALNLVLSYHSSMSDKESDMIKGLMKGFRTNYHQFLIQDGVDENDANIYKYIDENGYTHTFLYRGDIQKYTDQEGFCLMLDINTKTITDQKGNIYSFDSAGRLVSIQSGLNPDDAKIIEYNSDGLKKIYDARNPNVYIKFSYIFSYLQYIRVYCNNDSTPLKTYMLMGFLGQITSIEETVGNNTRTLYQYAVNDRDRIRRVVDCLTKVAYRITYVFDTTLNDYRVESLRKGYVENDEFIQHEGIYAIDCKYNSHTSYKTIRELVIRNDNNIELSLMSDTYGNPVAAYERDSVENTKYHSMILDAGIWIDCEGDSDDWINDEAARAFNGTLNVSGFSITQNDLESSPSLKLVGYIKLKEIRSRARLELFMPYTSSFPMEINPNAYNVWQYFEFPIERLLESDKTLRSLTLYVRDENSFVVNAEIADLQIVKSEPKQTLFFLNNGNPIEFGEITGIRIYDTYYNYSLISNDSSSFFMNQNDLLKTIKEYYKTSSNHKNAYFSSGKVIVDYFLLIEAETSDTVVSFFNPTTVNNDVLGTNTNWFFSTSIDAITKTYYRFKNNYYEVITRTKTGDNPETYETSICKYNYNDQLILETNKNNVKIKYEYFVDGTLKKKGIVSNDEQTYVTILYEAQLDADSKYIKRISQEEKSYDYLYDRYLLQKKIINDISGGEPVNQFFSIEYGYDNFLYDMANVKFKNIDAIEEEHNYSRPSVSYKTNYIEDGVAKYRINKNINNQTTVLGINNGTDYVDILTIQKTNSSTIKTYNNSYYSGGGTNQVQETYDNYKRLSQISLNGDIKVTFEYESNYASSYCSLLSRVVDNFANRLVTYTYNESNEVVNIQTGSFSVMRYPNNEYSCTGFAFSIDEQYTTKISEKNAVTKITNSSEIKSSCWEYSYDDLLRLSTKLNDKYAHNIVQAYQYSNNFPSRIANYSFDGSVYNEAYSYSQFYGHLGGVSVNTTNFSYSTTYQYDGFGRIVSEVNTKLGINRTYSYKNGDDSTGPVGRMTGFGNKSLTYDDRGRLINFGNNTYTYDEYGNRVTKNEISYQWTRGHLLSNLGSSTYGYDYQGIRCTKLDTNGLTHNYYYNGNHLVGENIYSNNSLIRKLRFFYDKDGLCAFRTIIGSETKDYIYIRNPFNDIVGITEGVTLKALYVYDAWGNHKVYNPNGTENVDPSFIGNINPFRYRGYYFDSDTNLYYLMSRYYDPEIGQFISPDDAEYLSFENIIGINLYSYCGYNPVMNCDPGGHLFASIIFGLIVIRSIGKSIEQASGLVGSIWRQFEMHNLALNQWNWKELGGIVSDIFFEALSFTNSYSFGKANPILGILSNFVTNQLINSIYYNYLSSPDSTIDPSSYNGGNYLTRWQRLDYTRTYFLNDNNHNYGFLEMHVFGEYSFHMFGFFAAPFCSSFWSADMTAGFDDHPQPTGFIIDMFSFIFSFLG